MAETKKKVEGEYLQYQGKPLVREENTIIYGDLNNDPFVLVLEIMSYKEEAGEKVPDKVLIQIVDAKDPNRSTVQSGSKSGLHDAFSLGLTWLDLKLKKSAQ
ncbi:MAG: hypothetical protein E7590_03130 [Ruminococcaceae bacterium]|nr:hypothetical protein [Oscillospiraceae bacterium]